MGQSTFSGPIVSQSTVVATESMTAPVFNGRTASGAATALTPTTGAVVLDPALNQVFTVVPTGDITLTASAQSAGQRVVLIVNTSGTTSRTITFSTGFRATGTLATGTTDARRFVLEFISDGTVFTEICRTAAYA